MQHKRLRRLRMEHLLPRWLTTLWRGKSQAIRMVLTTKLHINLQWMGLRVNSHSICSTAPHAKVATSKRCSQPLQVKTTR